MNEIQCIRELSTKGIDFGDGRSVANDLPSDLTIQVDGHIFYLHKVRIYIYI